LTVNLNAELLKKLFLFTQTKGLLFCDIIKSVQRSKVMEYAKKQFIKIMLIFLGYILTLIFFAVLYFVLPIDNNIKLSLLLIVLILALTALFWIKPRMTYHSESYSYYRLISVQNSPKKLSNFISYVDVITSLKNKDFLVFFQNEQFIILHRHTYDQNNLATRRPMLELFILIIDKSLHYKSALIDKQINLLEDMYFNKKTKITNYTIIIIKNGNDFSDEIKKECDEVTFSKIRYRSIVTINAFINEKDKTIYFLHSDVYHPNLYYKYATEMIQSLIIK
jgi:hypothetical protein